jgi:predicted ribosomally synthesized peptide with nif11-like leader
MSIEDLKKYGQLCAEQEEVRQRAKAIGLEDIDGHIAHARELGLSISNEDLLAMAKGANLRRSDELSEEELEKVAGGCVTTTAALVAGAVIGVATAAAAVSKPCW